MWRVLMLLALVPLVAAMLARQVWWLRVARRDGGLVAGAPAAEELAAELVAAAAPGVRVAKGLAMWRPQRCLNLPQEAWGSRDAVALGIAVQAAGMVLLAGQAPEAVAARARVLRMGAAAPVFAVVVGVFFLITAKAGIAWVAAGGLAVAGLAAVLQFATVAVEMRAAVLGIAALRACKPGLAATDRDRIESCARAAVWRHSLPLALGWLTGPGPAGD